MKKNIKSFSFIIVFVFLSLLLNTNNLSSTVNAEVDSDILTQYLDQQETIINNLIDTTYVKLSSQIQNTGEALKGTLNYRSLECLGAIKSSDMSSLSSLEKDKDNIKAALAKDFTSLASEISASSSSQQSALLTKIISTINTHKSVISAFEKMYNDKITGLSQDLYDYTKQNAEIIGYVNDKIYKLDHIRGEIQVLAEHINRVNSLLIGDEMDFFESFSGVRNSFVSLLDLRIQPLIDNAVGKYKAIPNLNQTLLSEKEYLLRMYGLDFDEKLNTILGQRYDKTDYDYIQTQIATIQNQYTTNNQLSCLKVFASSTEFDETINNLISKLDSMLAKINSSNISTGSATQIKMTLVSEFTKFNAENLTKKINDFKGIIQNKIHRPTSKETTTINNTNNNTPSIGNSTAISQPITIIKFTRPFRKGEVGTAIKNLQQLLKTNGYYDGDMNGVYTRQTIEAVYRFQLRNGLLKGYEHRIATRGWMGPKTRTKLNEMAGLGGLTIVITNMADQSLDDFVVGYETETTTSTTNVPGEIISETTSTIITGSTTTVGSTTTNNVVSTGSIYVPGSSGGGSTTTTTTTVNPLTQSELFYQNMINDIISPYTGDLQKEALQQAFVKTVTSLNETTDTITINFLQGFKSAIQTYLNNLQ